VDNLSHGWPHQRRWKQHPPAHRPAVDRVGVEVRPASRVAPEDFDRLSTLADGQAAMQDPMITKVTGMAAAFIHIATAVIKVAAGYLI